MKGAGELAIVSTTEVAVRSTANVIVVPDLQARHARRSATIGSSVKTARSSVFVRNRKLLLAIL